MMMRGQVPPSRQFHMFDKKDDMEAAISYVQGVGITEFDGIPIAKLFFWEGESNLGARANELIDIWRELGWVA